jgi:hypothetical protein
MPKQSSATALAQLIEELRQDRQSHVEALAELDATLARFGIAADAPRRRGGKPGRPTAVSGKTSPKHRRKRGHYDQTATEFVLGLLKGKSLTTKEVNAAWAKAGRGGKADNTLLTLANAKQIKRAKIKDGRGSEYSLD